MKPTDLQIGDYVLAKPSMMLIKVAAVHHKKVGYHAVTHKLNWVRMDLLEPIPLTPEILVLNGFEKVPTAPHNYFNSDLWDCDVIINISEDTYEDTWHVHNFTDHNDNAFVCFSLCYVHELQRALRLCGLNDLADNLKLKE